MRGVPRGGLPKDGFILLLSPLLDLSLPALVYRHLPVHPGTHHFSGSTLYHSGYTCTPAVLARSCRSARWCAAVKKAGPGLESFAQFQQR